MLGGTPKITQNYADFTIKKENPKILLITEVIMNKKNIILYSLKVCLTLLCTSPINAYFYKASYWENDDQKVLFLSDCHSLPKKYENPLAIVQRQRKDLLDFLETTKSFTIVEDLDIYTLEISDNLDMLLSNPLTYDPNSKLDFSFEKLLPKLKNIVTPLIGITQCCCSLGLPVANVDFRYFFVKSLEEKLTLKDAYEMCEKTISEIESYNDSPEFRKVYEQYLSTIKPQFCSYQGFYDYVTTHGVPVANIHKLVDLKIIHQIHNKKKSLQSSSESFPLQIFDSIYGFIQSCLYLVGPQINTNLIHIFLGSNNTSENKTSLERENHRNNEQDLIVVLAGGAHISRIEKVLPQLGYQRKAQPYSSSINPSIKIADQALDLKKYFHPLLNEHQNTC